LLKIEQLWLIRKNIPHEFCIQYFCIVDV
jgi:hypothetical protein